MPDERLGKAPEQRPLVKLLIELGPLVAFFIAYGRAGIYGATAVLMLATLVSLVASWKVLGRITAIPS